MSRGVLPRFFRLLSKSEHFLKIRIKYPVKMLIFQEFQV